MCHMPCCSRPLPARPPWRPRAPGTKFAPHRAWPALKVGMRQSRGRPDACEDMSGRGIALVARSSPHRCQAATLPSFTRQSGPEHSLPSNRRACARHSSRFPGPSSRGLSRRQSTRECCTRDPLPPCLWPSCSPSPRSRPSRCTALPCTARPSTPRASSTSLTSIPPPPRADASCWAHRAPSTASTPSPTRALPPATCASTCSRA